MSDEDVSNFLGISGNLKNDKVIVQQIKQTAYFIPCDLIYRKQNFLNKKKVRPLG